MQIAPDILTKINKELPQKYIESLLRKTSATTNKPIPLEKELALLTNIISKSNDILHFLKLLTEIKDLSISKDILKMLFNLNIFTSSKLNTEENDTLVLKYLIKYVLKETMPAEKFNLILKDYLNFTPLQLNKETKDKLIKIINQEEKNNNNIKPIKQKIASVEKAIISEVILKNPHLLKKILINYINDIISTKATLKNNNALVKLLITAVVKEAVTNSINNDLALNNSLFAYFNSLSSGLIKETYLNKKQNNLNISKTIDIQIKKEIIKELKSDKILKKTKPTTYNINQEGKYNANNNTPYLIEHLLTIQNNLFNLNTIFPASHNRSSVLLIFPFILGKWLSLMEIELKIKKEKKKKKKKISLFVNIILPNFGKINILLTIEEPNLYLTLYVNNKNIAKKLNYAIKPIMNNIQLANINNVFFKVVISKNNEKLLKLESFSYQA